MRSNPLYYINPSAISLTPNCNGSANDIAVYLGSDTKIKVYCSEIPALDYDENGSVLEWTLAGRNRRLSDSTKPYTIYARLPKSNQSGGYLVFAPKVYEDSQWKDKYAYVTQNGLATDTADTNPSGSTYWYFRLGDISLPVSGERTLTIDTGILGTDQYNNKWVVKEEGQPMRVVVSNSMNSDTPRLDLGSQIALAASLISGWDTDRNSLVDHWTVTRDTGDASADAAWNASHSLDSNRSITLQHAFGSGDDMNGAASAIFTFNAYGVAAEEEEEEGSSTSEGSSSSEESSSSEDSSSSDSSDLPDLVEESVGDTPSSSEPQYVLLGSTPVTVYAEERNIISRYGTFYDDQGNAEDVDGTNYNDPVSGTDNKPYEYFDPDAQEGANDTFTPAFNIDKKTGAMSAAHGKFRISENGDVEINADKIEVTANVDEHGNPIPSMKLKSSDGSKWLEFSSYFPNAASGYVEWFGYAAPMTINGVTGDVLTLGVRLRCNSQGVADGTGYGRLVISDVRLNNGTPYRNRASVVEPDGFMLCYTPNGEAPEEATSRLKIAVADNGYPYLKSNMCTMFGGMLNKLDYKDPDPGVADPYHAFFTDQGAPWLEMPSGALYVDENGFLKVKP